MDDARQRLLDALAEAIEEVGWDQVTTAEVARRAKTSKRTFYAHFPTKDDGFFALYELEAAKIVSRILDAIRDVPPGPSRARQGVSAYLSALSERPGLARAMLLELVRLGPPGLTLRRRVLARFSDILMVEMTSAGIPDNIASTLARVVVGGINELVLETVELDGPQALMLLENDVVGALDILATLIRR